MYINKYDSGLLHSCMYVVQENGHALIIDPCMNTDPLSGIEIDYLIVTHEHYDHISGVNRWKELTDAPLICSKNCSLNIKNPRKNMSRYFNAFCSIQTWVPTGQINLEPIDYSCEAEMVFENQLSFEWQGHNVRFTETPGHSLGSIIIDIDNTDFFTGDSMLKNYDIELKFPGGSICAWEELGKKRIDSIPYGAQIWPGHFDSYVKER